MVGIGGCFLGITVSDHKGIRIEMEPQVMEYTRIGRRILI